LKEGRHSELVHTGANVAHVNVCAGWIGPVKMGKDEQVRHNSSRHNT